MNLENILLGLINLHPFVSGYELKAIINRSTGYFFSASLSQIYPALKNLAQQEKITFEIEPLVGKQDRKVYSITTFGQETLKDWLLEPIEFSQSLGAFENFLLKLTFTGILEKSQLIDFLSNGKRHFLSERKRIMDNNLENEKQYLKLDPPNSEWHFFIWSHENEFLINDLNHKIQWIDALIEDIRNKND